jgi:excisionase family DNA binding protein
MSDANVSSKLFIKATEASRIIGVERRTLFRWAKEGRLPYIRYGDRAHWRFKYDAVCRLANGEQEETKSKQGEQAVETPEEADTRIEVIYARVSTRKQLAHLDTQVKDLQAKFPSAVMFRDCASGLNFRRKGLQSLLQQVLARRVRVVHVAYRDRLCRFAYDLIESIFKYHGTEITVEAHDSLSPESELADDVLSIITVFSARMHGRRSSGGAKRRAKREEVDAISAQGADEGKASCIQESDATDKGAMAGA